MTFCFKLELVFQKIEGPRTPLLLYMGLFYVVYVFDG